MKIPLLWVYFNLHREQWSMMQRQRVIGHAVTLSLEGVTFRVREGGRRRVLRTKRKNVHAFVIGTHRTQTVSGEPVRISYNPYKAGHFYRVDTGAAINAADAVTFTSTQVYAINPR